MNLFPRRAGRIARPVLTLVVSLLAASTADAQHGGTPPSTSTVPHSASGPTAVHWNALARSFVGGGHGGGHGAPAGAHGGAHGGAMPMPSRPLALLSVAQHAASRAAATPGEAHVAVAAASADVLGYLFPGAAARFAEMRSEALAAAARADLEPARVTAADSLGRAAAAAVLARARADGSDAAWQGAVPAGTGRWTSAANATPMGTTWAGVRPWALATSDQLRPAAPPAMGTPVFDADLDEVRQATRNRTPEQLASARKWAEMPIPAYWNEVAVEFITQDGLPASRAAEAFASLNVALMDAQIACFDAKYAHWSIRPSQADPGIDVPVELPNFPAYPSGHACLSAAAAEVLGHYFPARQAQLAATAQEVADSRLYAGVHYRVDNDVGLEMGRQVARLVIPAVVAGLEVAGPQRNAR